MIDLSSQSVEEEFGQSCQCGHFVKFQQRPRDLVGRSIRWIPSRLRKIAERAPKYRFVNFADTKHIVNMADSAYGFVDGCTGIAAPRRRHQAVGYTRPLIDTDGAVTQLDERSIDCIHIASREITGKSQRGTKCSEQLFVREINRRLKKRFRLRCVQLGFRADADK